MIAKRGNILNTMTGSNTVFDNFAARSFASSRLICFISIDFRDTISEIGMPFSYAATNANTKSENTLTSYLSATSSSARCLTFCA